VSTIVEEQILVVPTFLFHELGYFQGFTADVSRYLPRLLEGDHIEYRPRGQMENDPSFKQLIPYSLFRWIEADGTTHLFQYRRGSGQGERRLHAQRSVGVGGHISSSDAEKGVRTVFASPFSPSSVAPDSDESAAKTVLTPFSPYRQGMRRELDEEVAIDTRYEERIAGLINDDETPVGRVHLGIVHLCDVHEPRIVPRETDILDARFLPVSAILPRLEEFESWSQIAVRALFR
jgi:predicted NUDIX family phosphoesterase